MRVSMADLLAGCCVITVTTSSCLLPRVVQAQNKKRESRSVIHPSQGEEGEEGEEGERSLKTNQQPQREVQDV